MSKIEENLKPYHVVSFSGGKDSTAMLLCMLAKHMDIDEVVWIDTGKEHSAAYKHISLIEKQMEVEITKLSMDFDYWFSEHIKTKGKNKGERGYGWPTPKIRWCTARKRDIVTKYLNKVKVEKIRKIVEYHGIAADEVSRINKNAERNIRYPLIDWEMTQLDCLEYCYEKGFDWGGHYNNFDRLSCWCCPLASLDNLRTLYEKYPKLWKELQEMDGKTNRKFRYDYSVRELTEKFEKELCLNL